MRVFRWCDEIGGGLVIACSVKRAEKKLRKYYAGMGRLKELKIWLWKRDQYYDADHRSVLDIYGMW